MKKTKIISILITAIMLMQSFAITSFAEGVNTFPPQRHTVGNMKLSIGEHGIVDTVVGLRTNGTINLRAQELDRRGHGFSPALKNELLSLTNVVDIACNKNIVVALKSDGTVFVGQHTPEEALFIDPDANARIFNEASTWSDIVAIDCGINHLVGLKSDGTVLAIGDNNYGQCDVMGWNNVSSIYANRNETFAIRKDGTVLATGLVENFNEIRQMKNVKSLFYNDHVSTGSDIPITYQAILNDGTITCDIKYQPKVIYGSDIDTGETFGKEEIILSIDKAFEKFGYTAKIVNIVKKGYDDYYILDETGNLYLMEQDSIENATVNKLYENIHSIYLSSASDGYYALDKNGQIWTDKSAFNSSDWVLTTNITYDGKKIDSDVPPYVKDGRTLAPIRAILEALGMVVSWDGTTQTATAVKGNITISVSINSNIAYVNGEQKMLDVPAEITNGRTFVPVRFFGEALGMNVDWDGYTKTVIIESK